MRDVAIKVFSYTHPFPPPSVLSTFRHEYQLLEQCSRGEARHVVKYLGVLLAPRLAIATEFFPSGSLARCMKHDATWRRVSLLQKACIAVQVAEALSWLHDHDVVHRDIKSHNILLDQLESEFPVAKICDVGSAVVHHRGLEPVLTDEIGSSGYTAPEIFTGDGYSNKVDVWSFSIVLWELLQPPPSARVSDTSTLGGASVNPFLGLAGDAYVELARSGSRPLCVATDDNSSLRQLYAIVHQCWQFDANARPTMADVAAALSKITTALSLEVSR